MVDWFLSSVWNSVCSSWLYVAISLLRNLYLHIDTDTENLIDPPEGNSCVAHKHSRNTQTNSAWQHTCFSDKQHQGQARVSLWISCLRCKKNPIWNSQWRWVIWRRWEYTICNNGFPPLRFLKWRPEGISEKRWAREWRGWLTMLFAFLTTWSSQIAQTALCATPVTFEHMFTIRCRLFFSFIDKTLNQQMNEYVKRLSIEER